jgi:drug/metabolite transporter (DMT)-like permease
VSDSQVTVASRAGLSQPSAFPAYAALATAAIVWGGSVVFQKFALNSFSVIEVSVLRGVGALLILVPLWWWQEGGSVDFAARDLALFAVLSLGVLGNHLLSLFGLRYIGAGAAGIIIGSSPVITALLSSLLIRDVPFRAVAPGCLLSFAGVVLIIGQSGEANVGESPWLGGTLVVLGLVSWAFYTIGGRRMMERFSP